MTETEFGGEATGREEGGGEDFCCFVTPFTVNEGEVRMIWDFVSTLGIDAPISTGAQERPIFPHVHHSNIYTYKHHNYIVRYAYIHTNTHALLQTYIHCI